MYSNPFSSGHDWMRQTYLFMTLSVSIARSPALVCSKPSFLYTKSSLSHLSYWTSLRIKAKVLSLTFWGIDQKIACSFIWMELMLHIRYTHMLHSLSIVNLKRKVRFFLLHVKDLNIDSLQIIIFMLSLIHVKIWDSRVLLNMFFLSYKTGWFYSWLNKKLNFSSQVLHRCI